MEAATSIDPPNETPVTGRLPGWEEPNGCPNGGKDETPAGLVISATELGYYASWRFCPRCAWIRLHVKDLPFQGFPGIFSSIDRYNKLIVHNHFDHERRPPAWLAELGETGEYVNPPHWSAFRVTDPESGVTVRGEADGIFKLNDGSYVIVDYKTARYTEAQEGMFRAYRVQLNTYAYIAERLGLSPVSRLALVYMEPSTDEESAREPGLVDSLGFVMGFRAKVVDVELRMERLVLPLLRKAKRIYELDKPPPTGRKCRDCKALDGLIETLGR